MLSSILIEVAILVLVHSLFWFIVSLIARRNDVADIAWGLGFVAIVLFLYFSHPVNSYSRLLYALVALWGLRLSLHIGPRNAKKSEDFRYRQWREAWGKTFFLRSFLQVFLLQGFLLYLIALPLCFASADGYTLKLVESIWLMPFVAGWMLWVIGFFFQAVGDYQLSRFKKKKKPGQIMQTGLWKYSRHPNYFGEILMWWAIFIMVLPNWWAIISPLLVTWLLTSVSGVPMLEKKYLGQPEFEAYRESTNALIPWWPKRKS